VFQDADWPATKDGAFTRLRAKGAFLVSGTQTGGRVGPVGLTSLAGGTVRLLSPWKSGTVSVTTQGGTPVAFTNSGGTISFATTAGTSYQVTSTGAARTVAYTVPAGDGGGALMVLLLGAMLVAVYLAATWRAPVRTRS
jgi:hypothetical protein